MCQGRQSNTGVTENTLSASALRNAFCPAAGESQPGAPSRAQLRAIDYAEDQAHSDCTRWEE